MKATLITLILLFSINVFSSDFTYGVKIGGTYSTADSRGEAEGIPSSSDNNDYYWGTFFSFYGYTNINKTIDLQFEGNINQRGLLTQGNTGVTLQTFELVSLLKFNINILSLYVGGFSSITASEVSPLNFGYILGIEIRYKKFLIDFRYNQGFNNFAGIVGGGSSTYYDNSRQFVLSLGYEF
jgi:hypothetical protein